MKNDTTTTSLPERFAAQGQKFLDELTAVCRFEAGVFWWHCSEDDWHNYHPGDISQLLGLHFKIHPRHRAALRRAVPSLDLGPLPPELLRAVRRYARERGMQLIDGQWVRVSQAKWDTMPAEEYAALIMLEYDESKFSPEDWAKLAASHMEEILIRRGSGKRIDQARRKNRFGGLLTVLSVRDDIDQIRQQRHEIIERACPSVAS